MRNSRNRARARSRSRALVFLIARLANNFLYAEIVQEDL
jgi:hypothetical protein